VNPLHADVPQVSDFDSLLPGPCRHRRGLTPAPPTRGMVLRRELNVAELDVFDVSRLAMSDRWPTPA